MPFKSEKQRKYLHINKPSIAKAWEKKYALGGSIKKLKAGGRTDAESQYGGTKGYDSTKNVSGRTQTTSGAGGGSGYTQQSKIGPQVKDVPFKKPLGFKTSLAVGTLGVPFLGTAVNLAAKQQYKGRQRFAKKEGLYRDKYKTTGKVLQPNAPIGKQYVKDAGYGKNKISPVVGGGNDSSTIIPMQTTKPVDPLLIKPKDNFFNFVAYNVGGLSGGVSYGPPPKKGPNSNVPPIKLKKGGKR